MRDLESTSWLLCLLMPAPHPAAAEMPRAVAPPRRPAELRSGGHGWGYREVIASYRAVTAFSWRSAGNLAALSSLQVEVSPAF